MPKMRGIKPEIWTDEKFVSVSPLARLLFIGMWNYACDNGHVDDKPRQLKMRILPADDCNIGDLVDELLIDDDGPVVRRDGYLWIPKLPEHQRIDRRYFTTCEHCGADATSMDTSGGHDGDTTGTRREPALKEGRKEGECEGDGESTAAGKPRKKPSTRLPADWKPTDEHAARALQDGIDLTPQVARFRAHAEANDRRQVNWNAAFTQWLLNVPEWQRNQRPAPVRHLARAADLELPPDGLSPEEYAAWERDQRERRRHA